MFAEIMDSLISNKKAKEMQEIFKCVICQVTCSPAMYFCVTGCGQLIGCFSCAAKVKDCPLCRAALPDNEIRKALIVSGFAEHLGASDISQESALKDAGILKGDDDVADDDDDDDDLLRPAF